MEAEYELTFESVNSNTEIGLPLSKSGFKDLIKDLRAFKSAAEDVSNFGQFTHHPYNYEPSRAYLAMYKYYGRNRYEFDMSEVNSYGEVFARIEIPLTEDQFDDFVEDLKDAYRHLEKGDPERELIITINDNDRVSATLRIEE